MVSDKIILLKKAWNVAQSWSPFTIQEVQHKVRVIKQHSCSIRRPGFHTWQGPQPHLVGPRSHPSTQAPFLHLWPPGTPQILGFLHPFPCSPKPPSITS